jgi:hypothetical protein
MNSSNRSVTPGLLHKEERQTILRWPKEIRVKPLRASKKSRKAARPFDMRYNIACILQTAVSRMPTNQQHSSVWARAEAVPVQQHQSRQPPLRQPASRGFIQDPVAEHLFRRRCERTFCGAWRAARSRRDVPGRTWAGSASSPQPLQIPATPHSPHARDDHTCGGLASDCSTTCFDGLAGRSSSRLSPASAIKPARRPSVSHAARLPEQAYINSGAVLDFTALAIDLLPRCACWRTSLSR